MNDTANDGSTAHRPRVRRPSLMRGLASLPAFSALIAVSACDYTHPTDVFVPDDDVIAIAAVISAGFNTATLLATYPHRDSSANPPVVEAQLSGPGWTAKFRQDPDAHTPESLQACNLISQSVAWKGPASCLRAQLQQPIKAGVRYALSGVTELGAFSGTASVPSAPVIVDPSMEFVATPAADTFGLDLRYETPAGVGLIVAEAANVVQIVVDSAGIVSEEPRWIKYILPRELNPAAEGAHITVWGYDASSPLNVWRPPEFRFDLHLVGFDENFSRFAQHRYDRLVVQPWPNFGLSGDEGIYGYFGAASRSTPVRVVVRPR